MTCRKRVGKGAVTFSCVIPIPAGMSEHEGPCVANELPASASARQRWESPEAMAARATLAETQSQPQTFADQNPAHTASTVPGSNLSVADHRATHRPKVGEFGAEELPSEPCSHPFDYLMEEPDGALVCRKCVTMVKEPPGAAQAQPVSAPATEPPAEPVARSVGTPIAMPPGLREATVTEVPTAAEAVAAFEGEVDAVLDGTHESVVAVPYDPPPNEAVTPEQVYEAVAQMDAHEPPPSFEGDPGVPTKQRPGDQPLPTADPEAPCVQDAIIDMMEESKAVGIERYGQTLHTFNGRDCLQDALEEARDGLVYLTSLSMERAEVLRRFEGVAALVLSTREWPEDMKPLLDDIDFILAWLRGEPTS